MQTNTNTIAQLQKSVRRLRYGMAAIAIGAGVLVMGAMQDGEDRSVRPHLISLTTAPSKISAYNILYRMWSDGSIDAITIPDNGQRNQGWQVVQR